MKRPKKTAQPSRKPRRPNKPKFDPMSNVPIEPHDGMSCEEAQLNRLLAEQWEETQALKSLLDLPDGKGLESPSWLPTIRNLVVQAYRIDGFRLAFSSALGGVRLPTQAENKRRNACPKCRDRERR